MLATVDNMMASTYYFSALSDTGGGSYRAMTGTEQRGVFVPQSILAVSAAGADKDGVTDFARFLLSCEAQSCEPRNGFNLPGVYSINFTVRNNNHTVQRQGNDETAGLMMIVRN